VVAKHNVPIEASFESAAKYINTSQTLHDNSLRHFMMHIILTFDQASRHQKIILRTFFSSLLSISLPQQDGGQNYWARTGLAFAESGWCGHVVLPFELRGQFSCCQLTSWCRSRVYFLQDTGYRDVSKQGSFRTRLS
jgi:hypothetical protein